MIFVPCLGSRKLLDLVEEHISRTRVLKDAVDDSMRTTWNNVLIMNTSTQFKFTLKEMMAAAFGQLQFCI